MFLQVCHSSTFLQEVLITNKVVVLSSSVPGSNPDVSYSYTDTEFNETRFFIIIFLFFLNRHIREALVPAAPWGYDGFVLTVAEIVC